MPDKDIEALPHKERPFCPYEKEEYDAVTFSLGKEKVTKEKPIASDDALAEAENTDPPVAEGASISFGSTFSFSKEKVEEAAGGCGGSRRGLGAWFWRGRTCPGVGCA